MLLYHHETKAGSSVAKIEHDGRAAKLSIKDRPFLCILQTALTPAP